MLNKKTFCYKESIDECKYCFASWYFFEFYAFRQSSKQVKKYSDIAETALKDRSEITQEIASTKSTLPALNFRIYLEIETWKNNT